MTRLPNTNRHGQPWTETEKKAVWQKGLVINGYDPAFFRMDTCGYRMAYSQHGNRNSADGWEIDHINPVANGGDDSLINLQPLNWKNNSAKADKTNWRCGL